MLFILMLWALEKFALRKIFLILPFQKEACN